MIRFCYLFLILFSLRANAQAVGCISLEGIKMPCFGGGVACGGCGKYTDEERRNACYGTLPINDPAGCAKGFCGTKCCSTCSQYNPGDYYTCQSLPGACDSSGNPVSCGKGTKVPSCDEGVCADQAANRCGSYTCGTCGITCNGTKTLKDCYAWTSKSVPSGGSCGCHLVGFSPGSCNGVPTGASECGGVPNPCHGSQEGQCLNGSNTCWRCAFSPGNPGTCSKYCSAGSATCYYNPVKVQLCVTTCPSPYTDSPDTPPGGKSCDTVAPPIDCGGSSCPATCNASDC